MRSVSPEAKLTIVARLFEPPTRSSLFAFTRPAAPLHPSRRHARQRARGIARNAQIRDRELDQQVAAEPEALDLLGEAVERLGLSARGARRLLRVARTIADLEGRETTGRPAIAEALQLRLPSP